VPVYVSVALLGQIDHLYGTFEMFTPMSSVLATYPISCTAV